MNKRTPYNMDDLLTPESIRMNAVPRMLALACSENKSDVRASVEEAQAVLDGVSDAIAVFADYLRMSESNPQTAEYTVNSQVANGLMMLSGVIAVCQAAFSAADAVGRETATNTLVPVKKGMEGRQ